MLNLYQAYLCGQDLAVSLNRNQFSDGSRYANLYLKWRPYKAAYDGLTALGLIQVTRPGFHDSRTGIGRTTRIAATSKFIEMLSREASDPIVIGRDPDAETIILRDADKHQIDYDDTPDTIRMRENLKLINARLRDCGANLYAGLDGFSRPRKNQSILSACLCPTAIFGSVRRLLRGGVEVLTFRGGFVVGLVGFRALSTWRRAAWAVGPGCRRWRSG